MSTASETSGALVGLSDGPQDRLVADEFITNLFRLGWRLNRYKPSTDRTQLIVAISVPCRDYVAALIGAGWTLSASPAEGPPPVDTFSAADEHTYIRAVMDNRIVTGKFAHLQPNRLDEDDPIVMVGGERRPVSRYRAATVLPGPVEDVHTELPSPGFVAAWTDSADRWIERMATPPNNLAIVGTATWINQDLDSMIGNAATTETGAVRLSNYVLPIGRKAATWSTQIISSARLGEGVGLSSECAAAILDGSGAIKFLNEIEVPVVVCVVDRSVADESAAELILQTRAANSQPVPLDIAVRWAPVLGIEAMAFTVAI